MPFFRSEIPCVVPCGEGGYDAVRLQLMPVCRQMADVLNVAKFFRRLRFFRYTRRIPSNTVRILSAFSALPPRPERAAEPNR